jgi:hypothetical protein
MNTDAHRFWRSSNWWQEGLTAEYAKHAEKQAFSRFAFRVFRVFRGLSLS